MKSYLNDPKLKERFVKEIERHRKADAIIQGTYGRENGTWKGCAVGCSLRSLDIIEGKELKETYDNHKDYETKLGIPEWLAQLEDAIFEGLPVEDAKKWPGQFAKAVPVGADLEPVKWHFCAFLMKENIARVLKLDIEDSLKEQVVKAIQGVLAVHENAIVTGKWDESAARSVAWSAARSVAWSAARSAMWSAMWSAESAESAVSAESAAYQKYAKELIRLLKKAT